MALPAQRTMYKHSFKNLELLTPHITTGTSVQIMTCKIAPITFSGEFSFKLNYSEGHTLAM